MFKEDTKPVVICAAAAGYSYRQSRQFSTRVIVPRRHLAALWETRGCHVWGIRGCYWPLGRKQGCCPTSTGARVPPTKDLHGPKCQRC